MSTSTQTHIEHYDWCNVAGGMGDGCWPDGISDGNGGFATVSGMGHQSAPVTYAVDGFEFEVQAASYQDFEEGGDLDVRPYMFVSYTHIPDRCTSPRQVAAFAAALHAAAVKIGRQIGEPVP